MDEKTIQESIKINEKIMSLYTKLEKETKIFDGLINSLKITSSKLDNDNLINIGKPQKIIIFSQNSVYNQKLDFDNDFLINEENENDFDLSECQNIHTINVKTLMNFKFDNLLTDEFYKKTKEINKDINWNSMFLFMDFNSEYVEYFVDIIRNFNKENVFNVYLNEIFDRSNKRKNCEDYNIFITELRRFFYIYECTPIYIHINNTIITDPKEIDYELNDTIMNKENNKKFPTEFLILNINE